MKAVPVLATLFLLGACGGAQSAPVTVSDAWCRATPAGALTAGCFLILTAGADDRLVSAATPAAAKVEIHSMDMSGGVMRMRKLEDGLALPKGKAVKLAPGGAFHLMLVGPKAALRPSAAVPLTLRFATAPAQTITAPVR